MSENELAEDKEIVEVSTLLLEFEFNEFKEIFSTLQKLTEREISYKVIVAETRETGFPILELSGEKTKLTEVLAELGYSKDMLVIDDEIEPADEFEDYSEDAEEDTEEDEEYQVDAE